MLKRWLLFLLLFSVVLSGCGLVENTAEEATPEPDVDATVAAAMSATQTAAPTATPPPADTPTPEPEPSPTETTETEEGPSLNLDEATVAFSPSDRNFATELVFRLTVEGEVVSELLIDGFSNSDGSGALNYDFTNVDVAPTLAEIDFIEEDDTSYVVLPDGTCVASGMQESPIADMALNTGTIMLEPQNMVTGQLQWNGTAEVNGVTTDEYLIDADNVVGNAGITNMTGGVLNVATDGNYVVRLILEGSGETELLAPGVEGDLYYELNMTPSETPFEMTLPEACAGAGGVDVDAGDGEDEGDGDDAADEDAGDEAGDEAGVELVISQVSQNVVHTCAGGDVVVEGASNTITLTGNCNELVVHSAGNTIDVESAAAIIVHGAGNTIVYGGSPEIVDNGLGNTFTQQ